MLLLLATLGPAVRVGREPFCQFLREWCRTELITTEAARSPS